MKNDLELMEGQSGFSCSVFGKAVPGARLLVSVRSAVEAEAALEGGAALLDVKEPKRGSLGRATDRAIASVIRVVAGRVPVSAALGELRDAARPFAGAGLSFAKWGLSGLGVETNWHDLVRAGHALLPGCRPVAVAYADWREARAPDPADVCAFACEHGWGAMLIDTWSKKGRNLPDFLSPPVIERIRRRCGDAGLPLALAGSLGPQQIRDLMPIEPDWFAVRGAVCRDGDRVQTIDAVKVRSLVDLLAGALATPGN